MLLCPFLSDLKAGGAEEVTVATKSVFVPLFSAVPGVDRVIGLDPAGGPGGLLRIAENYRDRNLIVIDAHNNFRSRLLARRLGGADARIRKYTAARWGLIYLKKQPDIPGIPQRYRALGEELGLLNGRIEPQTELEGPPIRLDLPASSERVAEQALSGYSGDFIAVAPGSRWAMKKWPVRSYQDLLCRLADRHNIKVMILGDENDQEDAAAIKAALGDKALDLTGRTSILEAASYMKRTRGFIGNDSGLMHLAELVGVPVLALFGPTTDSFGYYPSLPGSKVCERELSCRPCSKNGSRPCYKIMSGQRQECLTRIKVASVEKAFNELLEGEGPRRYLLP